MKMLLTALALTIAAPAAAQTAPDAHAGHAAHAQHAQHKPAADPHAGHAGHDQATDHSRHDGCCKKDADGKMPCCEKMKASGKKMECCEKHGEKAGEQSGHKGH